MRVGDHRDVDLIEAGGPTTAALLDRVAAAIGPAVERVEAFWGTDWSRHIVVLGTGTDAQFRAAAGGGSAEQWADVAAVAVADRVDPARRFAAGQRVVLAPGAAAMSPAALHLVLTHELFHYAARRDTALDAPRWLTEGVADFVARPDAPRPGRAAAAALPTDADLDAAGPQRTLAYDRAWWFARFVADRYGPAKLRELYLAACGAGHPDPGTAVRTVLGTDLPDLLARWQRWLS
ncbi:hypothetical protein ACAG26_06515 [Mycobacterium sp. pUA109]